MFVHYKLQEEGKLRINSGPSGQVDVQGTMSVDGGLTVGGTIPCIVPCCPSQNLVPTPTSHQVEFVAV